MNTAKRMTGWLIAGAVVLAFGAKAHAAETQDLSIHVSITATKSLTAPTTHYTFGALTVNVASNSATALVVTNDSGALVETYRIQGGNAISDTAGTDWTLAGSPGVNQYALAAQFSTARPDNVGGSWSDDDLTGSAITCTADVFGNGTAGQAGVDVSPADGVKDRNLWFRIQTPTVVDDTTPHTVTVTLSVL